MRNVLLYGLCGGLGEVYTLNTPAGKKTFTDEAEYQRLKQAVADYDTAYGIAYAYNLTPPPNWADFEAGNGAAVIDTYRAAAAGNVQKTSGAMLNTNTGQATYSILLPVDGTKYYRTTSKEDFERYTRYISLYNECYAIAVKYGFEKPMWAQFEAGQGEKVLQQYKQLEANKLTADKEEAARIAAAATERAKAEADAAAALAEQKAAAADVQLAKQTGDAQAQQTAQAALAKTVQKAAEAQQAAQVAQAADVTYEAPAATGNNQTAKKGGIPWWGWALGVVVGGVVLYKVFGGKKKGKKK